MSPQYGELRPTSGWDRFTSLGYPCKFRPVSRLGSITARHIVVGVSQTLRRWTEGATYIRQGDHHVGHWPTFLVRVTLLQITSLNARNAGWNRDLANSITVNILEVLISVLVHRCTKKYCRYYFGFERPSEMCQSRKDNSFNKIMNSHNLLIYFCCINWYTLLPKLIMSALWNRTGWDFFALWFLSSFFLFFIPRLISAAADWMSTILLHMHFVALVRM